LEYSLVKCCNDIFCVHTEFFNRHEKYQQAFVAPLLEKTLVKDFLINLNLEFAINLVIN
jgi:hypothetical protein